MEYPLNIYITAHTLISSLGFGISENKKAIHDYRSGIRMQEAGRISDSPILAGMIDSVELEKRAKEQLEKRAKELNMRKPGPSQIVYVQVQAEDTAEVYTAPKEQNIFQRAFTALRNVFTDAVEYFT